MAALTKKDIKGRMILHINMGATHRQVWRDDENGIGMIVETTREKGGTYTTLKEYYTDKDPGQHFLTADEMLEFHNNFKES